MLICIPAHLTRIQNIGNWIYGRPSRRARALLIFDRAHLERRQTRAADCAVPGSDVRGILAAQGKPNEYAPVDGWFVGLPWGSVEVGYA